MLKNIIIESESTLREWKSMHPSLEKVFFTLCQVWPFATTLRITSMNRSKLADEKLGASGIHSDGPPWRAMDVGGAELDQDHLDKIAEFVNTVWMYDRNRPNLKCAVSKPHGTGKHIHLQVHKRTERNINGQDQ